ncbi:MAG: hypothetical protein R2705_21505 [Ilumatobacteraceae bacterium]
MRESDLRSTATATHDLCNGLQRRPTPPSPSTPSTPPHVESSAIVQFVDHQGQALAVVRDRGEVRLVDLGAMSEARNHVQFIAASVQRLNTADPAIQQRALASLLRYLAASGLRPFGPRVERRTRGGRPSAPARVLWRPPDACRTGRSASLRRCRGGWRPPMNSASGEPVHSVRRRAGAFGADEEVARLPFSIPMRPC